MTHEENWNTFIDELRTYVLEHHHFPNKHTRLLSKVKYTRKMGIQRQNAKSLFKSKDLRVIQRAADVMGVPWIFLVGYAEEPDIYQFPIPSYEEYLDFARQYPGEYEVQEDASSCDSFEIAPEDIPTGDSVEERRARQPQMRLPVNLPRGRRAGITSGARA